MSRLVMRAGAAMIVLVFVPVLLGTMEPLRFAIGVTIREILHIRVARWPIEVAGVTLLILMAGEAWRAALRPAPDMPFWRERFVRRAVATAAAVGAVAGVVDASYRGLSTNHALLNVAWGAASLAVLAIISFAASVSLERAAMSANRHGRHT